MSCISYQQMISQLLDGELPEPAAKELQTHLGKCSECQALSQRMAALDTDMRSIEFTLPRSALAEQVKARIAKHRSNASERHVFPSWARIPVMAVLVLCALGVGNLAGKSLSTMFVPDQKVSSLDLLVTDGGLSFTDALLEIGREGATR